MVTCYALVDGAATMWLATGALADAPVGMVSFDAPRRATKRVTYLLSVFSGCSLGEMNSNDEVSSGLFARRAHAGGDARGPSETIITT